ncbi:MAG: PAS domain S-box protein [Deltaproteobacteria bacterium]
MHADRIKEEKFLRQYREDTAEHLRWACLLGAAIMTGFMWQDILISSGGLKAIKIRIFGALPISALAWYLSRSLIARRFISYISAFFWLSYACFTAAIFIIYEPGPYGLTSATGLGSFLLILFGVFAFSNLRFWSSLLVGLLILLVYTYSVTIWTQAVFVDFIMGDFLTAVALLIGAATKTLFTDHARRRLFETTELLSESYNMVEHQVLERTTELTSEITERKQIEESLRESENRYKNLVENSFSCVYVIQNGRFVFSNNNAAAFTGYNREEIIGKPSDSFVHPEDRGKTREKAKKMLRGEDLSPYEFKIVSKTGQIRWIMETISLISFNGHPAILGNCIDITERRQREILDLHSQKMEAVGQLAAGIAHEINTPVQFIGDNITFIQSAFDDLLSLSAICNAVKNDDLLSPTVAKDILSRIREREKKIDLDFLSKEIPQAIEQSMAGLQRVSRIVQVMREISHPGGDKKIDLDINKAIESTIILTKNEWKYSAELITKLAPDLPIVQGYPSDFSQVIMNLIVNATQALQEKVGKDGAVGEYIEISTRQDGNEVEICIRDTGLGIPQEIQSRVFDPFFTTKDVGKGTGQGLAIAQNIIVQKHGGRIFFETKSGEGTSFYIRLPLKTM